MGSRPQEPAVQLGFTSVGEEDRAFPWDAAAGTLCSIHTNTGTR